MGWVSSAGAQFRFVTNNNAITITGYNGTEGIVEIPAATNGYPVTAIAANAFVGRFFTNVFIPNSVVSIGAGAFLSCPRMTNVNIPDGVTNLNLADSLFDSCDRLRTITLPTNMLSIPEDMFGGCYQLILNIPSTVTNIDSYAFSGCYSLTNVVLPNGLLNLGDRAFQGCHGLTNINIPNGVPSINDQTFYDCPNLATITLPGSVTNIGTQAFYLCYGLTSATIPASVGSFGSGAFDSCTNLTTLTVPGTITNFANVFNLCPVANLTIADGSLKIANFAFLGRTTVTNMAIPDTVTNIGASAFAQCAALLNIALGSNIITIGAGAFGNCGSLTNLNLPDSITSIGNSAFLACQNLSSVHLPAALTSISDFEFASCHKLTNIIVPNRVTNIGVNAFEACTALSQVALTNGLVTIDDSAFYNCISLSFISLPDTATNLGGGLFAGCTSLRGVTLPNGITTIREAMFTLCGSLTNVAIPNSVLSIGMSAFSYCSNLTGITIPNGVTNIGFQAFYSCLSVTNFFIPPNVNTIGGGAFANCANLMAIVVHPANAFFKTVDGILFDTAQTTLIQFPLHIGGSYSVPASVTSILPEAFQGCSLTNVTIPASAVFIGNLAFANSPQLTTAYFLGDAPGDQGPSFSGDATIVYYLNGTTGWGATYSGMPTAVFIQPGFNYLDINGVISITGYTGGGTVANIPRAILGVPVTRIGTNAFASSPITGVIIPDTVTNIGPQAFWFSALKSVVIPASVKTIEIYAFGFCGNLTQVYFKGNPPSPANDNSVFLSGPQFVYYLPGATGWGPFLDGVPAVLWNPQATSPSNAGGHFGFNITGPTNGVLVVEAATNLTNPVWQRVSTNALSNSGISTFTDPDNYPGRFYRFRSP